MATTSDSYMYAEMRRLLMGNDYAGITVGSSTTLDYFNIGQSVFTNEKDDDYICVERSHIDPLTGFSYFKTEKVLKNKTVLNLLKTIC